MIKIKRFFIYTILVSSIMSFMGCRIGPVVFPNPGEKSNVPAVCSQFVVGPAR